LAFKTGFSDDDANLFKKALVRLFEGDASSARPEGSMEVSKIFWWAHNCPDGQYSSAKVHHSLTVNPDGSYELKDLPGLTPEIIEGF
jgi:CRISPR-associated protein Csd2